MRADNPVTLWASAVQELRGVNSVLGCLGLSVVVFGRLIGLLIDFVLVPEERGRGDHGAGSVFSGGLMKI